jgi:hypothetical protein
MTDDIDHVSLLPEVRIDSDPSLRIGRKIIKYKSGKYTAVVEPINKLNWRIFRAGLDSEEEARQTLPRLLELANGKRRI